jgi:hypothetical protein
VRPRRQDDEDVDRGQPGLLHASIVRTTGEVRGVDPLASDPPGEVALRTTGLGATSVADHPSEALRSGNGLRQLHAAAVTASLSSVKQKSPSIMQRYSR